MAEEHDHDALGGEPPEIEVPSGSSRSWIVEDESCLEGTVEARDAAGNVVASWDQPCGRDQLRVDPPGQPIGAG